MPFTALFSYCFVLYFFPFFFFLVMVMVSAFHFALDLTNYVSGTGNNPVFVVIHRRLVSLTAASVKQSPAILQPVPSHAVILYALFSCHPLFPV